MPRLVVATLLCGALFAQQQVPPQQPPADKGAEPDVRFATTADYVMAPVLVLNRGGSYVSGLRPDQFRLFDNGKEQNIQVTETFTPISLVIAIQANSRVEKMLPTVNKIGNLIKPFIIGDAGEAAVIAFDSRVRTLQEFTSDPDKITKAVKTITPGSTSSRLIDALDAGVRLLRSRPKDRRRIMLVIGESRDYGSEGRGRETLINMQLANVVDYWVDMSHLLGILTAPPPDARPDPLPPAMHQLPGITPTTPTTVAQTNGSMGGGRAEFLPLMIEVFRDVKNIFKTSPATLFTRGTGGTQFNFYTQRGLEEAISEIGEQLHSQYLITYSPNNKTEGGFHLLSVDVPGYQYTAQTRPGYWLEVKQ